jgi:hypothetical protein
VAGFTPAVVRAWLDRQAAEAEKARVRAQALREDVDERRLERRRAMLGWSPGRVETYTVALVTDPAEMDRAKAELAEQQAMDDMDALGRGTADTTAASLANTASADSFKIGFDLAELLPVVADVALWQVAAKALRSFVLQLAAHTQDV